ncbi:hypothetical protein ACFPVY_17150 [Flavobacterium qiangtangense]|uniref:30S ribosomal protein S17 n=1 Tax=Flavobacterium qiangtangense TaxID=1442595 RepID=A0ABW1PS08_9FLAO
MAILKTSKNRSVTVLRKYTAIASKITKTSESINVDSTKENLMMNCIKKITAHGGKEK